MTDFAPTSRVIADSISPDGHRLVTVEATIHRFVLAELNTHRAFSRNSASSRAIPVHRTLARVADTPAIPLVWASERKGMSGGDEITDPGKARETWLAARDAAVTHAEQLLDLGVHKSVVNRLLEPFMTHTVIITATDWDGFVRQRCSPLAQPEIRAAADAIRAAINGSLPLPIAWNQWHLPYLSDVDRVEIPDHLWPHVSAARCARVSYLTHDGIRDWRVDQDLYQRLVKADPPHWSPLEHVARPQRVDLPRIGNFTGWAQLRHFVESF